MGTFRNSILGSDGVLIREQIRSPNFVTGVSGWAIRADGSAEFNSLVVRGDLSSSNYVPTTSGWFIGDDGSAEFNDLTVRGPTLVINGSVSNVSLDGATFTWDGPVSSPAFVPGVTGWEFDGDVVEFNDVKVDGAIVTSVIFSTNYDPGVDGWAIGDDGTAEFNNLQARGAIVADQIFSTGFNLTDGEVAGWLLDDDGSAIFTDVTIGSVGYSINSMGQGTLSTLAVTEEDGLSLGGESVRDLIDAKQELLQVWQLVGVSNAFTTLTKVLDFVIPNIKPHVYRVTVHGWELDPTTATATYLEIIGYQQYNSVADNTDILFMWEANEKAASGQTVFGAVGTIPVLDTNEGDDLHISIFCQANTSSELQTSLASKVTVEDLGPWAGSGSAVPQIDVSGGGGSGATQHLSSFTATATRPFRGDGSLHGFIEGVQGQSPFSANGNMQTAIGFDHAAIVSALAGATIDKIEIYLYYDHWYFAAGGTAVLGTHNDSDVAGATQLSDIFTKVDDIIRYSWARNEYKGAGLPVSVGNDFRDGNVKGILVGPGPTTSFEYYGKFHSHAGSNPPILKVWYTV